mmetsp:Transcript_11817/g.44002  ORF Transcript_11817/g.44002 Transcript_11817/m.44002 type:complete len:248 (+) Transcript_11817:822-1565(+)
MKESRQASGATTFAYDFLGLNQAQNRLGNEKLRDMHNFIDIVASDFEGRRSNHRNRKSICKGRFHNIGSDGLAGLDGGYERGAETRLHSHDLHGRHQGLDGQARACDEPRAAHRDNDDVCVRNLLKHLNGHGSCAGDDLRVVVAIDIALFGSLLLQEVLRLPNVPAMDDHFCSETSAATDFGKRCHRRHRNCNFDPQLCAVVGKSKRMVASRGRTDPLLTFLWREQTKRVACAALLEGAGELHQVFL